MAHGSEQPDFDEGRQLIDQQVAYYQARAPEYDEWFLRQGRYDRGAEHRSQWVAELSLVERALRRAKLRGEALELACGTGLWTEHLATIHRRVVAVDASPEAIALNRLRCGAINVEYVVADIFSWVPRPSSFDAVFFGFWLSHVPPGLFDAFWAKVRSVLKPGGRVFFVDSLLQQASTARDHEQLNESGIVRRRLNDGRVFEIVKVFYTPDSLEHRLLESGWAGWVRSSSQFFLFGSVSPAERSSADE